MKTELVFLGMHISVASRSRRRSLVALLYAALAALVIAWPLYGESPLSVLIIAAFLLAARFLGGRLYNGGLIPPVDSGDERELHRRDHAYFVAYWWWDLALIPAFLCTGFRIHPLPSSWSPALQAFLRQLPIAFLVAAGILYYTLPQAILLWTEPDMEEAA